VKKLITKKFDRAKTNKEIDYKKAYEAALFMWRLIGFNNTFLDNLYIKQQRAPERWCP